MKNWLSPTDSVISAEGAWASLKMRYSLQTMASIWAHAFLLVDILSMKLFVWALGELFAWAVDQNGGVLDSHFFFYDRYSDLAEYYRLKGRTAKAEKLAAIAEAHYRAAPDDDEPPGAAAMAMPVPRPLVNTNAVSTIRVPRRPEEPPSDLVPSPAP
jgi:hypothetical protein